MLLPNLWKRWGKTATAVSIGLLVCFVSLGFSSRLHVVYNDMIIRMSDLENGMSEMEDRMVDLKTAMNVDSIRQYNIQKIISVFDEYNDTLTRREKYEIANEIYEASQKYTNLSVELICATITQESGSAWKPDRISPAGAMGLMQIMPVTGMFMASYEGITWTSPGDVLFNPVYNIRIGTRYLSALVDMYGVEGGLAAYNGGESRARRWLAQGKREGILYTETEEYVPAVMGLYERYKNTL